MKNKFFWLFILLIILFSGYSFGQSCKDVLIERVINDTQCIRCYLVPIIILTEDDSLKRGLVESRSLYKFFLKKGFSFEQYQTKMRFILKENNFRPISYKDFGGIPSFIDATLSKSHERLLRNLKCKEDVLKYFQKIDKEGECCSLDILKDLVFEIWKWGVGVKLVELRLEFGFNCIGLQGG